MNASAITIVAYLAFITLLGVLLTRRNKSSHDWATAGGGMGLIMIAAGIAGTRIGGAGSYGVAGDVMKSGVWNVWYGITTFLALALVGLFFAVPYRRLNLTTISELFSKRYGTTRCGWLTSLCVQTEYLVVNVIEPLLIGVIVHNVIGLPLWLSIFLGAFVIIAATASSGLKGTSATNIIHCIVIIGGLSLVGYVAATQMGGWDQVVSKADSALASTNADQASWWSFIGLGWFPIIAMFFSATIHTPAASVYVNYSSSAKRENIIVPAFLLAGFIAALMPFLAAIIGIEALAKYGSSSGIAGYSSITQIALDAGPIVGGIALAAVLAALISSGGPILLASATMFVNDWVPGSEKMDPTTKLRSYRKAAIIYGLVAAVIACYFGYVVGTASVLKWLLLGYAMVVPPAIAIGFIFYIRLTTEASVYWGIVSGYALGLIAWVLGTYVFKVDMDVAAYFTTLVPLLVMPNMSLLANKIDSAQSKAVKRMIVAAIIALVIAAGVAYLLTPMATWPWFVAALVAPLAATIIYSLLVKSLTTNSVAWGLGLTYAVIAVAWYVTQFLMQSSPMLVVYASAFTSLVVIPTAVLAAHQSAPLDERAEQFYTLLKQPA